MTDQDNRPKEPVNLRQKAEAIARKPAARASKDRAAFSTEETRKTLHELQVHQIELEMQNEELRTAQAQIEAERERYYDLYDLAPVGYCTLSEQGLILEANLTAATLLGTNRGALSRQPFSRFIFKKDQDSYYLHRKQCSETGESQEYDLRLLKPDGAFFWAHLKATSAQGEDGAPVCRVALVDITKRKQAEEALLEREFFLNESQKAGNIGSYKLDFTTGRWESSEVLDSLLGIKRDYPKSIESWVELIYPDDRQMMSQYLKDEIIEKRNPFNMEYRIMRRSDETVRWMHGLGKLSFDNDDNLLCMIGTIQDITARKLAEIAMRANEAIKNKLVSNIGDVIVIIDQNGINKYKSPGVTRLFGWKPEELIGKNTWENVHPDDLEAGQNFFGPILAVPNATGATELRYKRKDGNYVWIGISVINLLHDRDIQGILGNYHDITERKQAETYREMRREILQILNEPGDPQEALPRVVNVLKTQAGVDAVGLRLQEGDDFPYFVQDGFPADFLQTENTLVERDKDGGLCRDKDGKVRLECTCGLVISGQTDLSSPFFTKGGSSWTNDSLPYLDLPSDQDPRLHPRNNCIRQGYASVALIPLTYSRENCIRHNFSSMVQVPIRTSDRIVGLLQLNDKSKDRFTLETIEILESIAAHIGMALMRKRAEAEQKNLQSQLSQAQKMEAIGTMAGGIAHDFNNLLAIVSSNIQAIQIKQQRKSPFEKNVENIITASTRGKRLVSQILAFSRQEKTELKPIDLSATIDESLKLLRSTIPKTIEIMNVLANQPIFIDADSTLMQQVLFNICNNATYAMNGKGLLKIALNEVGISFEDLPVSSKLPAGTYAKLSISDTGPGIAKDTINKIFDPFFTTKAVGAGTGMGLSVVHGIVEQHGGFITVDSSPGHGTTFDIYFPARVNLEEDRKTSNAEPLPTGTERILFVDDEECIAYTCNELLECQGYQVTSVTSGDEALDLFRTNPDDFDLVITDQTMPVMSGAELATELLKIRPDIPIILCSGYSAMVSEEGAKGIGIREFCMKPMDMQQLATVVRKVLDEISEAR